MNLWRKAIKFSVSIVGLLVLAACADGRLRLWRSETSVISEMTAGHVIDFSGDGRFAVTLNQRYENGQALLWEIETGRKLPAPTAVPDGSAFDLALSEDGSTAAVAVGPSGYGAHSI